MALSITLTNNNDRKSLDFNEGGVAVDVSPNGVITEDTADSITSVVLEFLYSYQEGADILGFVDTSLIEHSWDAIDGKLTLTPKGASTRTASEFTTALNDVTFVTTASAPTAVRTIKGTVTTVSASDSDLLDVVIVPEDAELITIPDFGPLRLKSGNYKIASGTVVDHSLRIIGVEPDVTITITGTESTGGPVGIGLQLNGDGSSIENIASFNKGNATRGIQFAGNNCSLLNTKVYGNDDEGTKKPTVVYLGDPSASRVGFQVLNCDLSTGYECLYLAGGMSDIEIAYNYIHDVIGEHAIYGQQNSNKRIHHNKIERIVNGQGVKCQIDMNEQAYADNIWIYSNTIHDTRNNNAIGFNRTNPTSPDKIAPVFARRVRVFNNEIVEASGGIALQEVRGYELANNTFSQVTLANTSFSDALPLWNTSNWTQALNDLGPYNWWRLSETAFADEVIDSAGYMNGSFAQTASGGVTVNQTTLVPGDVGGASATFDKTNGGRVQLSDDAPSDVDPFSIEPNRTFIAFFKPSDLDTTPTTTQSQYLFSAITQVNGSTPEKYIHIMLYKPSGSSQTYRVQVRSEIEVNSTLVSYSLEQDLSVTEIDLNTTDTFMLAVVLPDTASERKLYMANITDDSGVVDVTPSSLPTTTLGGSQTHVRIGAYGGSASDSNYYDGGIDEVVILHESLDVNMLESLYSAATS